ncbi:sigma-54 interaction domain-containing protein [Roseicyclus mahoneyensis]|uniref:Nif-specific regulatory protein n=1 Tax=Roseicyclus mahoneyensis TaxID=164332 RepID=A0A316GIH4_9RHOB|nr:sigma-54 dependent transcriptional regulator [Roseicyclus mahoneyensis]PWK60415.1 Fis family sigma54 specific transcriptional regulator [Roseicyclus mahoneyensis]
MSTHWTSISAATTPDQDLRLAHLLVGESPAMARLKTMIARVAPSPLPVMVQGPTGAGKEVVTQAVHMLSGRPGPLVAVNCAAIPADLLESELFGHEKGAFTGATDRRPGRVEQAQGGTLFLDEIGDMPPALQAKLLRVLETRRVQRLGGREEIEVDFRLVTATHRDLSQEVAVGRFRQDLFYRINVIGLSVPGLSDRSEDIPALLDAMLARYRVEAGPGMAPRFSTAALRLFSAHVWPGNVRELRNVFDRAAVLFPGEEIGADDARMLMMVPGLMATDAEMPQGPRSALPDADGLRKMLEGAPSLHLRSYLQDIEVALIEAALDLNKGCVAQAARSLRLKRTTMIEKMKKLSITRAIA